MFVGNTRAQFKASLKCGVCAVAVGLGMAGTAAAQADDVVQVTGTRIRATGMSTPTPVTVIQADELENIAPGNLINALDQIPQFLNNQSPNTAASKADSAGASNVNLRGIGSKRTLVLLNGRRVVPSNRLGNVDVNLFPEDLVERVETVTGGASAAYGTDAVAGVVNFILDTDFEGLKGHAQAGITDRGDNENFEIGLTAGTQLNDRLHLVVSGDYYEADRIDNLDGREWYTGEGLVTNPAWTASRTAPQYLVLPNVNSTIYTDGGVIDAPGTSINRLMFNPDGSTSPFVFGNPAAVGTGTQSQSGGSGYNATDFDPTVSTEAFPDGTRSGSFVPDSKRASLFANLEWEATDNLRLYVQGLYGYNYANSVGTLPLGHSIWAATIYSGNPYLPADIQAAMDAEGINSFRLQRYNTAADIAQDRLILENQTYSFTTGLNWQIDGGMFAGWEVDAHYQGGRNENHLDFENFVRRDKLPLAVDAVRDGNGNIVCNITVVNPGTMFDGCVPVNLLGKGRASQAAVDWVSDSMYVDATTEQHMVEASANGEIYDGWGAGAVSLAVGGSYREQSIEHLLGPDDLLALDSLTNNAAAGIRGVPIAFAGQDEVFQFVNLDEYEGSFNVKEAFAETLIPLVAGTPGFEQLNLTAAARYADYSGSGGIWAWKAGLDWQIYSDLRLRGTLSRDVRAGSLEERFDRQGQGTSVTDPEQGDLTYTTFRIRGGNPNIEPEKAETITVGGVYQPSYLPGLSVSLDYYKIEIEDAMDFLSVQEIVDQCSDVGGDICSRITRDPGTGLITEVLDTYFNLGAANNEGIDLETVYRSDVNWLGGDESISARLLVSWLLETSTTNVNGVVTETTGQIGLGSAPDSRATFNVTYRKGPFSLFLQERYISGGVYDVDWVEGVDIANNTQGSVMYTDARVAYDFGGPRGGDWTAFFNVTNVFDRDPAFVPGWSSFSGTGYGTNEGLYDTLGRRFVAGIRFRY